MFATTTTPAKMKAMGRPKMPNAMTSGGMEFSWKYKTNTATSDSAESIARTIAVREITDKVIEEELTPLNDTADLKPLP